MLVLKDDLSGYRWMDPTQSSNGDHAASVLSRWTRTFGGPKFWVCDGGSHFINNTLQFMAENHRVEHRPTVAYPSRTNGTVERLMRDIATATKAVLGELKLGPHDWQSVVEMVASVISETPLPKLG